MITITLRFLQYYSPILNFMTTTTFSMFPISVKQWHTNISHYTLIPRTFIKRQLQPNGERRKPDGSIITLPDSFERLKNERDALIFIASNTTIPVPIVLTFVVEKDGERSS